MFLLQSAILYRARINEISRRCEPSDTRRSPARSRSALRIKLDVRRARRENPAG